MWIMIEAIARAKKKPTAGSQPVYASRHVSQCRQARNLRKESLGEITYWLNDGLGWPETKPGQYL